LRYPAPLSVAPFKADPPGGLATERDAEALLPVLPSQVSSSEALLVAEQPATRRRRHGHDSELVSAPAAASGARAVHTRNKRRSRLVFIPRKPTTCLHAVLFSTPARCLGLHHVSRLTPDFWCTFVSVACYSSVFYTFLA